MAKYKKSWAKIEKPISQEPIEILEGNLACFHISLIPHFGSEMGGCKSEIFLGDLTWNDPTIPKGFRSEFKIHGHYGACIKNPNPLDVSKTKDVSKTQIAENPKCREPP